MKFTITEMNGLLNGKCIPTDLLVGETLSAYLVRKLSHSDQQLTEAARYGRQADITIENLERKVAQLAAELSAVDAIHNDAVFITDDHYDQCPPEVQKIIRSLAVLQIPAYQAYLAEVRASTITEALKSLDGVFDTDCVMEANGISYEEAEHRTTGALAVNSALIEFAFQLRQGGTE